MIFKNSIFQGIQRRYFNIYCHYVFLTFESKFLFHIISIEHHKLRSNIDYSLLNKQLEKSENDWVTNTYKMCIDRKEHMKKTLSKILLFWNKYLIALFPFWMLLCIQSHPQKFQTIIFVRFFVIKSKKRRKD